MSVTRHVLVTAVALALTSPAWAGATGLQFDPAFAGGASAAALRRIEAGVTVPAGSYPVDLYLNRRWVAHMRVTLAAPRPNADAVPCVAADLLQALGVKPKPVPAAGCVQLGTLYRGASLKFDMPRLQLDATVPQAFLQQRVPGYTDPSTWMYGVPAATLQYNVSAFRVTGNTSLTDVYAGTSAGFNVGRWQFRNRGSLTIFNGHRRWTSIASYAQRILPKWRAVLTLGDSFTDGSVFDSFGLRGIQLATDDRMLPQSQRGYAPVIRGVADSNASVTVSQNGVQIYRTTVAPGPFEIKDLYPTGAGGDLVVTVTGAHGDVQSFTVPYSSVPLLQRPGRTDFDVAVGTLRDGFVPSHPGVAQAAVQHGFSDWFSGYAGAQLSAGYASALVGAAFNTRLGAFSLDLTDSHTSIPGAGDYNGQSLRLRYSKVVPGTRSRIAVSAYRYSTRGFADLDDAEAARWFASRGTATSQYLASGFGGAPIDPRSPLARLYPAVLASGGYSDVGMLQQRSQLSLSLSQPLGRAGSIYADVSAVDYWGTQSRSTQYQVGYNVAIGRATFGVSASRGMLLPGRYYDRFFANLTLPLGHAQRAPSFTASATDMPGIDRQQQATLAGSLGDSNQVSYSLAGIRDQQSGSEVDANIGIRSSAGQFSLGASRGRGTSEISASATGAIVAFRHGLLFGQAGGDALAIVHAAGAEGAAVGSTAGVAIGRDGYALMPNLVAYQSDPIRIDPADAAAGTQIESTTQNIVPVAGAVALVDFRTHAGRSAMVRLTLPNGQPVPFGAAVGDATVGQGGIVLLHPAAKPRALVARWSAGGTDHACRFTYSTKASRGVRQYAFATATCAVAPPPAALSTLSADSRKTTNEAKGHD